MVYQALQWASSQNTDLIKQAEQKLAEWEVERGFFTTLVNTFLDQSLDGNVRWMAAVYFKNGVNKYWRKNSQQWVVVAFMQEMKNIWNYLCLNSEVNGEEKIAIKSALISSFREPVPQIAVQIAELIARIARYVVDQI